MDSKRGCKTCKKDAAGFIKHRPISSHMVLSHFLLIIPCIWWLFGPNNGDYYSVLFDKFMAGVLTLCISTSIIYHYYYECVICYAEQFINTIGAIILNLYMIYRGVSYMYIGIGLLIVALLKIVLECAAIANGNGLFETYHPLCHYIAGIYVIYCVYFIKKSFN